MIIDDMKKLESFKHCSTREKVGYGSIFMDEIKDKMKEEIYLLLSETKRLPIDERCVMLQEAQVQVLKVFEELYLRLLKYEYYLDKRQCIDILSDVNHYMKYFYTKEMIQSNIKTDFLDAFLVLTSRNSMNENFDYFIQAEGNKELKDRALYELGKMIADKNCFPLSCTATSKNTDIEVFNGVERSLLKRINNTSYSEEEKDALAILYFDENIRTEERLTKRQYESLFAFIVIHMMQGKDDVLTFVSPGKKTPYIYEVYLRTTI